MEHLHLSELECPLGRLILATGFTGLSGKWLRPFLRVQTSCVVNSGPLQAD